MSFTLKSQFRGDLKKLGVCSKSEQAKPDQLDLVKMASLALNYLKGNPDPKRAYECKFALGPLGIPFHVPGSPSNEHGFDVISLGDTDCRMDMQFPHMREIVGIHDPDPAEIGVRQRILRYLDTDCLCWLNPGAIIGTTINEKWASTWASAKLLYSLSESYERTQDVKIKKTAQKIFKALHKIAIRNGNRAYYWGIAPYKNGHWLLRKWSLSQGRNYPYIVEPLLRYYECCGDEAGLELANDFADGILDGVQPEMGRQRIDSQTGRFEGHIHIHTHSIWGVAHLGALTGEKKYSDFARRTYEFVLSLG
ncbi:MAG: hypothetical protein WC082_16110, partial [Victivallales bacterium]